MVEFGNGEHAVSCLRRIIAFYESHFLSLAGVLHVVESSHVVRPEGCPAITGRLYLSLFKRIVQGTDAFSENSGLEFFFFI